QRPARQRGLARWGLVGIGHRPTELQNLKPETKVVERIVSRVLSLVSLPPPGGDHSSERHYPGRGGPPLDLRPKTPSRVPVWPCSGWGLPCDPRHRGPGALLPHPFTLT